MVDFTSCIFLMTVFFCYIFSFVFFFLLFFYLYSIGVDSTKSQIFKLSIFFRSEWNWFYFTFLLYLSRFAFHRIVTLLHWMRLMDNPFKSFWNRKRKTIYPFSPQMMEEDVWLLITLSTRLCLIRLFWYFVTFIRWVISKNSTLFLDLIEKQT